MQSLNVSGVKLHRDLRQMADPRPYLSPSSLAIVVREDTVPEEGAKKSKPEYGNGLGLGF